jgi:hypothetical protein
MTYEPLLPWRSSFRVSQASLEDSRTPVGDDMLTDRELAEIYYRAVSADDTGTIFMPWEDLPAHRAAVITHGITAVREAILRSGTAMLEEPGLPAQHPRQHVSLGQQAHAVFTRSMQEQIGPYPAPWTSLPPEVRAAWNAAADEVLRLGAHLSALQRGSAVHACGGACLGAQPLAQSAEERAARYEEIVTREPEPLADGLDSEGVPSARRRAISGLLSQLDDVAAVTGDGRALHLALRALVLAVTENTDVQAGVLS